MAMKDGDPKEIAIFEKMEFEELSDGIAEVQSKCRGTFIVTEITGP